MRNFVFRALALAVLFAHSVSAQQKYKIEKKTEGGYTYLTVTNDPLKARIYTLNNGLRVYLSVYKNEPRIQTYIAVRAGSKNDPATAQGLAHYLEHILFKGTSKLGTQNWKAEKPLLDKVEALYQTYRQTTDTVLRKNIYHQIDSVSGLAANYAIANEYDKAMSSIGASGTNAYTWVEQTVYVNEIPSNNLEKWAIIESNRFQEVVPRLFHTELEAVYEEKNRGLDNDGSKTWEALFAGLFPTHTYGSQTTIGTVEHLKNPSITEIKKYFNTYYAPNNVAICLSGDLNPTETIRILNQYFGKWKTKDIPPFSAPVEEPITKPIVKNIVGPTAEKLTLAYRFAGVKSRESLVMELLSQILSNSQAGLIDLNLNQKQKMLGGGAFPLRMKDYSSLILSGSPREGQTLEEVQKLLLAQIDSVKQGRFGDWLIPAIINDVKTSNMKSFEKNTSRADAFVSAFVLGMPWKDYISEIDEQSKITKQEIVDFANKYLSDNYVAVFKRIGTDSTIKKIVKPEITAVSVNRDSASVFYKRLMKEPSGIIKPVFVDYQKDIQRLALKNDIEVLYKQNSENGLFDLYYVLDMGTDHNLKLGLAVEYLKFLGSNRFTAEQLKQEFFKLGCTYSVFTSSDKVYVALNGLQENFDKALGLFEELLASPQADDKALSDLVDGILKSRTNNKLNKGMILQRGLASYAKYGSNSPFTNILSAEELKTIKSSELTSLVSSLTSFKHRVLYYGPAKGADLVTKLNIIHKTPTTFLPFPPKKEYKELPLDSTKIYWANYDMVQAEMLFLTKSIEYDKNLVPMVGLFNEYFGGSMSSIVFQEIRESKALAYSVRSSYSLAGEKGKSNYIVSYIGTQADKLPEAMNAMEDLLDKMPQSESSFQLAKESILKSIETERVTKADVLMSYESAKKLGIDYDIRKDVYAALPTMTMKDMSKFHETYLSKKPQAILLIGSRDKLDFNALKKYGPVKELTLTEIFGY
jgi:predicted Zn-dependent peptidase